MSAPITVPGAQPGDVVVVNPPPGPPVVVLDQPGSGDTVVVPGPQPQVHLDSPIVVTSPVFVLPASGIGPSGPPGPSGQPRFAGEGPPVLIIGASPGDEYVDNLTGDIYRLS